MEENYLDYSALVLNSENYPLALEILDTGLAHIPHSYRLLVQKGVVLDKLMRRREAEEVLRSAIKIQDDNRVALIGLAGTQAHDHRPSDAAETLSKATEQFPTDAYMRYCYGLVLVQLAERQDMKPEVAEAARRELEKAIELNPTYSDAHYQLAKTYLETDPAKAVEELQACLRHQPDHYSAEMQLGRLYRRMGREAEGDQLLNKAIRDKQAEKEKGERISHIFKANPSRNVLATPQKEEVP
jgi:tetratricopeptide (TPR) repeat protein